MNNDIQQTIRKTCQCGLPVKTGTVQKDGPNKGKLWEACGNLTGFKKEEGGCGYFKMYLPQAMPTPSLSITTNPAQEPTPSTTTTGFISHDVSLEKMKVKETIMRMDLLMRMARFLDHVDTVLEQTSLFLKRSIENMEHGYQTDDEAPVKKRKIENGDAAIMGTPPSKQ